MFLLTRYAVARDHAYGERRVLAGKAQSRLGFDARLAMFKCLKGGAEGDRTPDLCIANAALSQLSYRPNREAESSFCAESVNQKTARR